MEACILPFAQTELLPVCFWAVMAEAGGAHMRTALPVPPHHREKDTFSHS